MASETTRQAQEGKIVCVHAGTSFTQVESGQPSSKRGRNLWKKLNGTLGTTLEMRRSQQIRSLYRLQINELNQKNFEF